jgi:hypothetical protein
MRSLDAAREISSSSVLPLAALVLLLHGVFSAIVLRRTSRASRTPRVEDDVKRAATHRGKRPAGSSTRSKTGRGWDDVWHYVRSPTTPFVART